MRCLIFLIAVVLVGAGCKDPRRGQSNANETPVPDGQIILLKRKNEVAAFVLRNQQASPEQTDFQWYYRSDGKGTFTSDPAVTNGYVSNATRVAFTTFGVDWSINQTGVGWIYFSQSPTDIGKAADFLMCVTAETNLAKIDANDGSWNYRARPGINVKELIKSQTQKDGHR